MGRARLERRSSTSACWSGRWCGSAAATATRAGRSCAAWPSGSRRRIRLPRLTAGSSAAALHRFAALWLERSRGLATRRAETLLHAAAAALALGLIAGLYLRGLVFDYRVGWQSTFLTPEAAHAVVTTLLAPAARLSGIALPDVAGVRGDARGRRRKPPAAPRRRRGSTCWR